MCFSGVSGSILDPVGMVAGKNSAIAQVNKMAVDPAGLVLDTKVSAIPASIRDPYGLGDKRREAEAGVSQIAAPAADTSLASTPRSTKRTGQILAASTPGAIGSQTPFTTSLTGLQTQLGAK